jgi:hypothetical protein
VRKEWPVRTFSDPNGRTVAVKAGSTWFRYLAKRYQLKDVREIPAAVIVAISLPMQIAFSRRFGHRNRFLRARPKSNRACCFINEARAM